MIIDHSEYYEWLILTYLATSLSIPHSHYDVVGGSFFSTKHILACVQMVFYAYMCFVDTVLQI